MSNLTKESNEEDRGKEWHVILNRPLDNPNGLNFMKTYRILKAYVQYIAMIEHDKEEKGEGAIKTYHIHIALITFKRTRKSTLINDLGELLKLPQNCITVSKVKKSFRGLNRYLIHMDEDESEKPHYAPFLVVTNAEDLYNSFLIEREENIYEEKLIEIVREDPRTSTLLKRLGRDTYNKWRNEIRDLQREYLK